VTVEPWAIRECAQFDAWWQEQHPASDFRFFCNAKQMSAWQRGSYPADRLAVVLELLILLVLVAVFVEFFISWWEKGRHRMGSS
jgi:TorA maturation chaperone TorD